MTMPISVPRRNRQGAIGGAILRHRDRTARPLRVVHYSSAVNKCRSEVYFEPFVKGRFSRVQPHEAALLILSLY